MAAPVFLMGKVDDAFIIMQLRYEEIFHSIALI